MALEQTVFEVIITFGLIFVFTSSLASGLATTVEILREGFRGQSQWQWAMVPVKFIVFSLAIIGLAMLFHLGPQDNGQQITMAVCVIALTAGAPFIPRLTKLAKGNVPYAVRASFLLNIITVIILPLILPPVLNLAGTGASISAWDVAWPIYSFVLIPLVAGLLIRWLYEDLAAEMLRYLRPSAIVALLLHVTLYIVAAWTLVTSLYLTGVFAFAVVIPIIGLIIALLLCPPKLGRLPKDDPQRGSKIVALLSVPLSNTGAVILMAIFPLGQFVLAGVAILILMLGSIFIELFVMAELGKRYVRGHPESRADSQKADQARNHTDKKRIDIN